MRRDRIVERCGAGLGRRPHRVQPPLRSAVAALIGLLAATPGHATAPPPAPTPADFVAALDRETSGRFSELRAAGDPTGTLEHYDALVSAYTRVVDGYDDSFSRGAIDLPVWWVDVLGELGLYALSDAGQLARFRVELDEPDFDRVVHAFTILSRNRVAFGEAGLPVEVVRAQLFARARADADDRFWISLWLAESRLFGPSPRLYTQMANPTESVRERVGKNARVLGPRIHRVLDLPRDRSDQRVTHYQISRARAQADDRIRRHWLLAGGAEAGWASVEARLLAMRDGRFRAKRFQEIVERDLRDLLEEFGPPEDPQALKALVRSLYEERGQYAMTLRVAVEDWERALEARIAVAAGPSDGSKSPTPRARPSAAALIAAGPDAAHDALLDTLRDTRDREAIASLLDRGVLPEVVAAHPPSDPEPLERALVAGYAAIGHPAGLRPAYLAALSALQPAIEPEAARGTIEALRERFEAASDRAAFGAAFRELHRRADRGAFARDEAPPVELAGAILDAAARVVSTLEDPRRAAAVSAREAASDLERAGREIAEAERTVAASNQTMQREEAARAAAEGRYQAAALAHNAGVEALNGAVTAANAARRQRSRAGAGGDPDGALARAEADAIARAEGLERELDGAIETAEASAVAARRDVTTAEERTVAARREGERARRRAGAALVAENRAFEAQARWTAELELRTEPIRAVLSQSLLALDLLEIEQAALPGARDGAPRTGAELVGLVAAVLRVLDPPGPMVNVAVVEGAAPLASREGGEDAFGGEVDDGGDGDRALLERYDAPPASVLAAFARGVLTERDATP